MSMFNGLPTEEARIEKHDGIIVGPYQMLFAGNTIIIADEKADVEEGDTILRALPSGKDERSLITNAKFFKKMHSIPSHYQIKFTKGKTQMSGSNQHGNITIQNAHSVQIGDNNTQNVINSFQYLIDQINSSDSSPEEKEEAKSYLNSFIKHPLIASLLGAGAGALLG